MNDLLNVYIGLITFITQSETDSNFFYCVETNSDSRRGEHPIKIKREAGGRLGRRGRDKSWASCVDVAMATVTVSFWSGYFNWARPRECGSVCRCAPLVDCVHECVCVFVCVWLDYKSRSRVIPWQGAGCIMPECIWDDRAVAVHQSLQSWRRGQHGAGESVVQIDMQNTNHALPIYLSPSLKLNNTKIFSNKLFQ